MKTLYVGNLPWSTTSEELSAGFGPFVEVKSCRIITDRDTGRSRGFCFAEVAEADVQRAIEAVNGIMLGGRQIVVNEARPRQPRS